MFLNFGLRLLNFFMLNSSKQQIHNFIKTLKIKIVFALMISVVPIYEANKVRIQTFAVISTFIGMINCTLIKLSIKNFHNDGALYFLFYSILIDFALFEHPLHCIVLCATCIKAQFKMKIKL